MKILVTGAAGFIGFHTALALLARGDRVIGLDNLNSDYDVSLKEARLAQLLQHKNFCFHKIDLLDCAAMIDLFVSENPQRVINLAAQTRDRNSLENPQAYVGANILGFLNLLENCRNHHVEHLVFASSSSVYGANNAMPFSAHDSADHPLSLNAASNKSNELMAHTYAHLFRIPVTGLRFFTVYGPWGRPDMAPFIFTQKIITGDAIDVFNNGKHSRDFIYIDDAVQGILLALDKIAEPNSDWSGAVPDPATSTAPYRLYNIGNSQSVELMHFIECIEKSTGKTARKNFLPMQPGDIENTIADIDSINTDVDFEPVISIEEGVERLVAWHRDYYKI